jgi:hypothetical protein
MGGLAVRVYGIPRPTHDMDFTAAIPRSQLAEVYASVEGLGYSIADSYKSGWVDQVADMPLVKFRLYLQEGRGVDIDVFLAESSFQWELLARRRPIMFEGATVWLVSPEDLILLKLLADRPRDIADIGDILFTQASSMSATCVCGLSSWEYQSVSKASWRTHPCESNASSQSPSSSRSSARWDDRSGWYCDGLCGAERNTADCGRVASLLSSCIRALRWAAVAVSRADSLEPPSSQSTARVKDSAAVPASANSPLVAESPLSPADSALAFRKLTITSASCGTAKPSDALS